MRRATLTVVLGCAVGLLLARPASAVIVGARIAIGTTPTLIAETASGVGPVLIKNAGAASVYLGGPTVTATSGYELVAGDAVSITLAADEAVYGVVVTGTVIVHKLENRK